MLTFHRSSALSGLLVLGAFVALAALIFQQSAQHSFVQGRAEVNPRRSLTTRHAVDDKLKKRIATTKNTAKITDAMRLVSAAKVRKAQDAVKAARPFSEELLGMIKGLVKKLKGTGLEAELPMLRSSDIKNVGILHISSDTGLCGAYNTFVTKRLGRRIADLNKIGVVPKVVIVGRKGFQKIKKVQADFEVVDKIEIGRKVNATLANIVATSVKNLFLAGEVDKVEVCYQKFKNMLISIPSIRTLLPLTPTSLDDPEDETFELTSAEGKLSVKKEKLKAPKAKEFETDMIFDQPPEVILNSMLPLYLNSIVLSYLMEAQASEISQRMTAMKAATDNAEKLAETLKMEFNKKRQASITAEILEIAAACIALESKEGTAGPDPTENSEAVCDALMEELGTPAEAPAPAPAPAPAKKTAKA